MNYDPISDKVRRWTLTAKRGPHAGEPRLYEQTELTIDGEMALIALGNRAFSSLTATGYDISRLGDIFPDEMHVQDINWGAVTDLLSAIASAAPPLIAEAAAVLVGIFPTDENGARNPNYADEVSFLRSSIGLADFVEMLETFLSQNDIERLRRPFERAMRTFLEYGARAVPPAAQPSPEPSNSSLPTATERPAKSRGGTRGRRSTAT